MIYFVYLKYCCIFVPDNNNKNKRNMRTVTTTRYNKVENTDQELLNKGVEAFQLVKFTINFYGNEIETTHDTKIMNDGRQIVIGGCGYIKEGYELN